MANIRNLLAVDSNEMIFWNPEQGHLESGEGDAKQLLLLTSRPYFTVKDVKFNPMKNLLALIGDKGVTIVEMPRKWGQRYKNASQSDKQVYCKTYNLNERLFKCEKRLRVLQASWHPQMLDSAQVLCILTNDSRLRFHDAKADSELQVIHLNIQNEYEHDSDEDDAGLLCSGFSMLNLGETAVCFDFAPPVSVQKPELLYPIYVLMGTGDVLLVYSNLHNPTYAEHIIGPLTVLPQAEDNYGSDACSLIVLDSSPPLLAIATPSGAIYHCFAFVNQPNCLLPSQTLYVYESIEISKDLIENPDDPYCPHPMRLFHDPTSEIRYFCVHQNGVHTVVVPMLESLESESEITDERESFSEFLICTRTSSPAEIGADFEDESTPCGLGVEIRQTNIVLLVLMHSNQLLVQRISPATTLINRKRFPRHSLEASFDASDREILNVSQVDASRANFEEQVQQILKRKTNVPMFKLAQNLEQTEQVEELLEQTMGVFKSEYLKKYNLAIEAIKKKLGLLESDMKNQKAEFSKIQKMKDEVYISVISLSSKADMATQKQKELLSRIDRVLATVTYGQPEMSEAETKLRRELATISDKLRYHRDHLDSIENKHKYHMNMRDSSFNTSSDLILSPTQLNGIRETLARHGAEILELKKFVKTGSSAKKSPQQQH